MDIDVNHAELHTATVELKMITVNQRQMTLSVFRQIPPKRLINLDTLTLNGVPWGWVNYFWPGIPIPVGYGYEPTFKINVVWQQGEKLYRDVVFPLDQNIVNFEIRTKENSLAHHALGILKDWLPSQWKSLWAAYGEHSPEYPPHNNPHDRWSAEYTQYEKKWQKKAKRWNEADKIEKAKWAEKWIGVLKQYNQLVESLHKMDQLFIAVGGGGKS